MDDKTKNITIGIIMLILVVIAAGLLTWYLTQQHHKSSGPDSSPSTSPQHHDSDDSDSDSDNEHTQVTTGKTKGIGDRSHTNVINCFRDIDSNSSSFQRYEKYAICIFREIAFVINFNQELNIPSDPKLSQIRDELLWFKDLYHHATTTHIDWMNVLTRVIESLGCVYSNGSPVIDIREFYSWVMSLYSDFTGKHIDFEDAIEKLGKIGETLYHTYEVCYKHQESYHYDSSYGY